MSTEYKQVSRAIAKMESTKIPTSFDKKQVEEFRKKATEVYDVASAMIVTDIATKATAEALARSCADMEKRIRAAFKPQVDEAAEKKRIATAEKAAVDEVVSALVEILKEAKSSADQKARAWQIAENKRIDDENRERQLKAQKAAEKEREKEVKKLEKVDTPEARRAARELAAAPVVAEPVEMEKRVEASRGTVYQAKWEAHVANGVEEEVALLELVKAAAQNPMRFLKYLSLNMPAINRAAVADKEKFDVPGFFAVDVGKTLHR